MFVAEMIIFVAFPGGALLLHQLRRTGDLPARPRAVARLRLPDGAYDHLREHPQHQPRASWCSAPSPSRRSARWAARRSAFSSSRRCPKSAPGAGCSPARSFRPCSSRSAASTSSRAPTGCPRGAKSSKAEQAAKRLLVRKPQYPTEIKLAARGSTPTTQPKPGRPMPPVQQRQSARDDPRLGSVVPAGSRHLRHRHFHADHPGRRGRRQFGPRAQRRRSDRTTSSPPRARR